MSDIIYPDRGIPEALRAKLEFEYGEDADKILAAFERERPVTFRVNRLKADEKRVFQEFAGFTLRRAAFYEDAFILEGASERDVQKTSLYEEGGIYLQSLSSMLPPLFVEPKAGESILDMTAAPGGKTTQLSALSGGGALITACERDKFRFERLRYNVEKQGAGRVTLLNEDARNLSPYFRFDKVLLDAPCSGSGTLSPSNPVRWSEKLLAKCVLLQRALLKKAFELLKPGGTLVYSTCSVLREENEEAISSLKGARLVPLAPPEGVPLLPSAEGTLCVRPDGLFEGFFVAKLQKLS